MGGGGEGLSVCGDGVEKFPVCQWNGTDALSSHYVIYYMILCMHPHMILCTLWYLYDFMFYLIVQYPINICVKQFGSWSGLKFVRPYLGPGYQQMTLAGQEFEKIPVYGRLNGATVNALIFSF